MVWVRVRCIQKARVRVVWLWWCPGGGGGALVSDVIHNSVLQPNDPPDDKTADRYPTVEGVRVASVLMCGLGCAWTHTISEKMTRDVLHLHTRTHTHTYTHTLTQTSTLTPSS